MKQAEVILDIEIELRKRMREREEAQRTEIEAEKEAKEIVLNRGRKSLWHYSRLRAPRHYTEDKVYLRQLCDTLQALFEGRIIKYLDDKDWQIVASTEGLQDYRVCKKLIMNMPPRHFKSRSLINFCQWAMGNNQETRVIECSYNDMVAGDFAKYVRDGITEEKVNPNDYVFSDFFPEVKIKHGSHSYYKWALEGQHFNYLGAGIMGSITGKGANILIIDDPIKLADEAFNEDRLQKIWDWYTGTFLSRGDAEGGEPLEIFNMTRWAEGDPCGRLLNSEEAPDWYVFKREAYDAEKKEMLCDDVLSIKRYEELKKKMMPEIFLANYHQETVDQKGRLYKSLKTYTALPKDSNGKCLIEQRKNYTDTADEGDDYLCSINYGIYQGEAYLLDVLYTKDGMEITEPQTAKFLLDGEINAALIESNNGGRGFARAVRSILWERYKTRQCVIYWFHQSENKRARIISQSNFVQEHIYFPVNWKDRWPEFYHHVTTFLKEAKWKHEDAEDALTGVAENSKPRLIKSGNKII